MRRADWLARLTATVEAWRDRPFRYGESDCVRFAADCVEAVTGRRHDTPYHNAREAIRLILNAGGLVPLVSSRLGPPHEGRPRRGDVCLVDCDEGPGLGVSLGTSIAVPADRGLGFHPVSAARRHWRIE